MGLFTSLLGMFTAKDNDTTSSTPFSQEEYKGYLLTATPAEENSQFRINGLISKDEREHPFIRADVLPSQEMCAQETFRKAKLMIDQQGDNLFN
ncbi:HlyU family transcriptional regulator [Neptunomonas japonica]|uniref:HlyU family transcriptional regulator n=1 Tax=Neptunomonas japonica TaxID=417574 RepID=UPI0004045F3E|nr:HlyU family transcriptional regulator [Neptunomonas japonica]